MLRILETTAKSLKRWSQSPALSLSGFMFLIQGSFSLSADDRAELLRMSIIPAVGIIIIVFIFIYVKNRFSPGNIKLDKLEMDSLRKEMTEKAEAIKRERKSEPVTESVTNETGQEKAETDENSIEGDSLV